LSSTFDQVIAIAFDVRCILRGYCLSRPFFGCKWKTLRAPNTLPDRFLGVVEKKLVPKTHR